MLFINRKYPFVTLRIYKIIISSIILFLILYILRPFGFYNYSGNIFFASLIFGLITFCCICFFNYIVKDTVHKFVKRWTLLSEITYILSLILIIFFFNFLFLSRILNQPFSFNLLFNVFYYTIILGIILTIIVTFEYHIDFNNHLDKFIDPSKKDTDSISISISTNSIHEKDFDMKLNSFIYAEAEKNNVMIYFYKDSAIESKLIRATLSTLKEQLDYPNIFQCHRSFIVNLNNMESAKGNSNGYQISFRGCKNKVQVSRKYVNEFKSFIY